MTITRVSNSKVVKPKLGRKLVNATLKEIEEELNSDPSQKSNVKI